MRFFQSLPFFFTRILDYTNTITGILIVFVMGIVCFEIAARYLGHPTLWTQDIAEKSIAYIVFLGTAFVLRKGGHISMDAVIVRLKPQPQTVLSIIHAVIIVIISALLLYYGSKVTGSYFARGLKQETLIELPIAPLLIIIPIGSFLLLIESLRQVRNSILKWRMIRRGSKEALAENGKTGSEI